MIDSGMVCFVAPFCRHGCGRIAGLDAARRAQFKNAGARSRCRQHCAGETAEIPLGNPVTEKETAASNPPLTVTVRVVLLFDPAVSASELAAADA